MQSRPAGSSSATPVPLTPLGNHPEQLHALAQRWQAGDRSDALRAEIDDKFELILGLLKGLRDFTMTNPAHQACIGEGGLATIAVWERLLAHLPCGAVSSCPQRHPLKPRSNFPKGALTSRTYIIHHHRAPRLPPAPPLVLPQAVHATAVPPTSARESRAARAKRASSTYAAAAATTCSARKLMDLVIRPASTSLSWSLWGKRHGERRITLALPVQNCHTLPMCPRCTVEAGRRTGLRNTLSLFAL
jgi:hypothetical protein